MSPWTDAVEALNPEFWLKFDPVTPKTIVNSGSIAYTVSNYESNFWNAYDWTTSAFGAPGGVRGGSAFGNATFVSPVTVTERTYSTLFRWDGYNIIWNASITGTGNWNDCTFSGRFIAVYTSDFFSTGVPMELLLDGNWHMVTMSATSSTLKMYLDGELIYSTPIAPNTDLNSIHFFDYSGSYDECLSFHRVLTDAEIAILWGAAVDTGLISLTDYDGAGQRMALDVDGSVVTVLVRAGEELEIPKAQKRYLMDGSPNLVVLMCPIRSKPRITIIFPEPRDLFGFFISGAFGASTGIGTTDWMPIGYGTAIQVSRTAVDHTASDWSDIPISWGRGFILGNPYYGVGMEYIDAPLYGKNQTGKLLSNSGYLVDTRLTVPNDLGSNVDLAVAQMDTQRSLAMDQAYAFLLPVRNVRAVRLNLSALGFQSLGYMSPTGEYNICLSLQGIYLYGQKSNSDIAVDHSLDIWQENRFAPMELKMSAQGMSALRSSQDFRFCVTNRSSRATARDITIRAEALVDNVGASLSSQFMFWSTADLSHKFYRELSIGSLAPGEQSETIVVRRVTPVDATEGLYVPRILAQVGWWD